MLGPNWLLDADTRIHDAAARPVLRAERSVRFFVYEAIYRIVFCRILSMFSGRCQAAEAPRLMHALMLQTDVVAACVLRCIVAALHPKC